MSTAGASLKAVLEKFLSKVLDANFLILSTLDGVELLTVYNNQQNNEKYKLDKQIVDCLVMSYSNSISQVQKAGFGQPQYTISWLERGGILLQIKIEALIISIAMDENSNLGLTNDYMNLLKKILDPFSNANFMNLNLS